jgi:hypothetical protein
MRPQIHHYRMREGVTGYRAGDVLHDRDTDTWALAVADGRGVALAPLSVRRRTGETGVGDWRLTPLDVGSDLRGGDIAVAGPDPADQSVGLTIAGEDYEITGPPAVLVAVARAAGYAVAGRGTARRV